MEIRFCADLVENLDPQKVGKTQIGYLVESAWPTHYPGASLYNVKLSFFFFKGIPLMRNVLNIIADILTLLAITVAGVGHMLPWFMPPRSYSRPPERPSFGKELKDPLKIQEEQKEDQKKVEEAWREQKEELMDFQGWHAIRSGVALGVLTLLVGLSLVFTWGPTARRFLVLLMFVAALTTVVFLTLPYSAYPLTEMHRNISKSQRNFQEYLYLVALIPICIALGITLLRMIWTMPPVRDKSGSCAEPQTTRGGSFIDRPPRESGKKENPLELKEGM